MAAQRLEFIIEGMDCADCARTIEKAVSRLPGVGSASVNFGTARLSVAGVDNSPANLDAAVERTVSEAGYRATPARKRETFEQAPFWRRERRVLTTAIGAVATLIALALRWLGMPDWLVNLFFAATI